MNTTCIRCSRPGFATLELTASIGATRLEIPGARSPRYLCVLPVELTEFFGAAEVDAIRLGGACAKRFRLSTVMLAVVIASLCFALVVQQNRAARREARLQAEIKLLEYDHQENPLIPLKQLRQQRAEEEGEDPMQIKKR